MGTRLWKGGRGARRHDVLLGFAVAWLTGCAGTAQKVTPEVFALPQLYVQARNGSPEEVTLYSLRDGRRSRIGFVHGGATTRFTLEWQASQILQFELHRSGGSSCFTRKLEMKPGEAVEVWMEPRARVQNDGVSRECDMRRAR